MELVNTNVGIWNARGLNNPARRGVVKTVMEDASASVVCLSESKLETVTPFVIAETLGTRFDGFVYLPAIGTAGGIIVAWQSAEVRVLRSRVDQFSVSIELAVAGGDPWWLTAVYGPTVDALKPAFLDELRVLRASLAGPWALAGDFNLILEDHDKNNANVNRRAMARFWRLINNLELKESPLVGRRFTWSNERASPTLEKIERWFGSLEWDDMHPDASLCALLSSLSSHCPILMSTSAKFFSKSRFRFERVWVRMDGFMDEVSALWNAGPYEPNPLIRLDVKLRGLARGLQRWSQRRVGSIKDQLLMANELILLLDRAQDDRVLSSAEAQLRRGLKARVLGLASLDRTIARQRARVAGISEGDTNAEFFRIYASSRRRRNFIAYLRHNSCSTSEQADKEDLATDFYIELLGRAQPRDCNLSLASIGLGAVDLSSLDMAFSVEEVWTAIKAMPSNKSPGPDGFSWDFYKAC
jgi:hypothetical protein